MGRFNAQNATIATVGKEIQKPVRPLSDLAYALVEVAQVTLFLYHMAIVQPYPY
jgi:hypothetical protein